MLDARQNREKTIRDAKCTLILDAALLMFAQKGFFNTRLEDIAVAAGFSKASLYNYYNDKETIFLNLAIREYETLVEQFELILDKSLPVTVNLERLMKAIFERYGKHFPLLLELSDFRRMATGGIDNFARHHMKLFEQFKSWTSRFQQVIHGIVVEGRARGEIRTDIGDDVLVRHIGSLIRGILFDWNTSGRVGDIGRETKDIVSFIANGIEKK